jgi:hypothetical protein
LEAIIEIAPRHVDELLCLAMDGFHHSWVAMASVTDSNPGSKIEESVPILILHPGPGGFVMIKGLEGNIFLRDGMVFLS